MPVGLITSVTESTARKFGGCDEGAHNADEAASPPTNYRPAPVASQEQQLQLIPTQEQEQHKLQQLNLSLRIL
jgi:hypothetical protein